MKLDTSKEMWYTENGIVAHLSGPDIFGSWPHLYVAGDEDFEDDNALIRDGWLMLHSSEYIALTKGQKIW